MSGELASAESLVQAALERSTVLARALEQLADALTAYQRLARDSVRFASSASVTPNSAYWRRVESSGLSCNAVFAHVVHVIVCICVQKADTLPELKNIWALRAKRDAAEKAFTLALSDAKYVRSYNIYLLYLSTILYLYIEIICGHCC